VALLQAVSALVSVQPALLEMAPTSLKARLESLAALFGAPTAVAAQLVLKHPVRRRGRREGAGAMPCITCSSHGDCGAACLPTAANSPAA
jgi:hypothetical protein